MGRRKKLLSWMPPSTATFIYTTLLKPRPLRLLAQAVVKRFIPEHLTIDGVEIVMNRQDAVVCGALSLGVYERMPRALFMSAIGPRMTVIDVGANIGLYSAQAARLVGPEGRVLAVEPDRANCAFIEQTVARNGFRNVDVVCAAVADRDGPGALHINDMNKADHRIFAQAGAPRRTVPVQLTKLDSLVREKGLERVDIIKIDIQGAEGLALAGMRDTLAANPSILLWMEFWPWGLSQCGSDARDVLATLRGSGFHLWVIDDRTVRPVPADSDHELLDLSLERQHANLLLGRDQGRLAALAACCAPRAT